MVYTYLAPEDSNLSIADVLQQNLDANRLDSPHDLAGLPEDDVVIFLNFGNNPEFEDFVKHWRLLLTCRSMYITQGVNEHGSNIRGHYNITIANEHVIRDITQLVSGYVEGKTQNIKNWKSRVTRT